MSGDFGGQERRGHEMCNLVIEHHAHLAQMGADISHIKKKIDNGLTEKMDALSRRLDKIDKDSWVTHLLSGGVKKLIGLIFFLILVNALASNFMWAALKEYKFKEQGAQEQVKTATNIKYHENETNGKSIWVWDRNKRTWTPAPELRAEDQLEQHIKDKQKGG